MTDELYNKIDKFCNETDWSKYPTYEHALEDFIKGIVAEETKELEKENAELKDQLTKAKEIIKDLLNLPFASNEEVFADVGSHLYKAEQFLNEGGK